MRPIEPWIFISTLLFAACAESEPKPTNDGCKVGSSECGANAACIDDGGTPTCACVEGYARDGDACVDIDECATGADDCDPSVACTNTPGSFECGCAEGYSRGGAGCVDIDECLTARHDCGKDATCRNTPGAFECVCESGYAGDGHTCTDVDECATGAGTCGANEVCKNDDGSFSCSCLLGFEREDEDSPCVDVDECATGANDCHRNATCTNTVGAYACACNEGFGGNGFVCSAPCATDLPGPPFVSVTDPTGGVYCVDATEVTNAHYAAFLAASSTIAAPSFCAWNSEHRPQRDWPFDESRANHPVAFVDWCDAFAYCAWAQKRLCGAIRGGSTPYDGPSDDADRATLVAYAGVSQWYNACSKSAERVFSFGDTFDQGACNGPKNRSEGDLGDTVPVDETLTCEGGFPGLFHMSGNVAEWEDSCSSDRADANCHPRGGSYFGNTTSANSERCLTAIAVPRSAAGQQLGFRCCSQL